MSKQTSAAAADEGFRPEPGEQFQVRKGYQYDDDLFKVIDYSPITAPPEKIQELYRLPELPTESVDCFKLEKYKRDGQVVWVGTARHTFPTAIMVPVGSTAKAYREANGGKRPPRQRTSGSGFCEHCGEATGGGRFLPGHDAKLKSELRKQADNSDDEIAIPAIAEAQIRAAEHRPDNPTSSRWWFEGTGKGDQAKVNKLVKQGDGFLRSAIAARIGRDPGRRD